jgi:hypothetical protein
MNMIGHQDVGTDAAVRVSGILQQPVEIEPVILVGEEADLPVIATLNQMKGDIRQADRDTTGHGKAERRNQTPEEYKKTMVCPPLLLLFFGVSKYFTHRRRCIPDTKKIS